MARAERGPSKKPTNPSPTGEGTSRDQLPLVRVPKSKHRKALRVCVVCESAQRSSRLLDTLQKALADAGLSSHTLHSIASAGEQSPLHAGTDTPDTTPSIMLAVFDKQSAVLSPTGCLLVCETINDHVLRAAFASCAAGVITREELATGLLLSKLQEASDLLTLRAVTQRAPQTSSLRTTTLAPSATSSHAKISSPDSLNPHTLRRTKREDRLLKAARNIAASRDALASQLALVCEQLSQSCMDVSNQLSHVAVASELQTLLRQELDIESVLRTSLEFLLRRMGPANAAIYLPSTTGDYTLGAYINYDCPRDGIEQTLDHLCDALAPDFADRPGLHVLGECERDLPAVTSAWVQDSTMLVYTAHADDECAAIVAVFRDQTTGFDAASRKLVSTIGGMLGEQLTRIVKTHHRWKVA